MKIKDVIKMANMMEKGNVLDPELAIFFLSELDGMIQSDMMLHGPEEIVSYTDQEQELLLRKPHDGIYLTYLVAMIRQCQGEFEGYENAQKSVDEKLKTFRRWYIQHYRPADTASRSYTGGTSADAFGFAYLTAYGLAVKHGYQGTEEEWLRSLEGQPGAPGEAARMRFDAGTGMIQWGVGEEWYDLFTLEELREPAVEAMMQEVRALAEAASGSEAAARGHAKTAADAAADALGSAGRAYASEQTAVTAAGDAQVQAETAQGYALRAEAAAKRAEAAAKRAEEAAANPGQGDGSGSGQNVALTPAQISTLDGMFRVGAFDPDSGYAAAYAAFQAAFGLSGSGSEGGSGGDDSGDTGGDTPGDNTGGVSNETAWVDGVPYTYELVAGEYVKQTGQINTYDGWSRTPYLYCAGATRLDFTKPNAQMADYNGFYNVDKQHISNFRPSTTGSVEVPETATYFVCSGPDDVMAIFGVVPVGVQ